MFLHPWAMVLGVLAAGLPVAIHFLTRPRPHPIPLSTLRFVREAVQQRRARHRLRDAIILALRTCAVLLLASAIARPLWGTRQEQVAADAASAVRIVVVDVSQSMAAQAKGIQAFERARPLAMKHFEYRDGLAVNLILAGARSSAVFGQPSTNLAALREEMSAAAPRPETLDVQAAINLSAEMLAGSGNSADSRKELFIISDFQRSNWAQADFSPLPADTVIELEPVGTEPPLPNLSIVRVKAAGRLEAGREARLAADVGNFSSTPRLARVEVSLGDAVYQLEGNCPAGTTTTLTADIVPRDVGWQTGEAKLVGVDDSLPADNVYPCVLEVRQPPVFALITRQAESLRPSSSYYLERGLVPIDTSDSRSATKLVRLNPSNLDREALAPAELIAIDHPGPLDAETISYLASLLRRGRGILYVAAEPVDASNLKLLSDAAGTGLQMPVEFVPPPQGQSRRDLFLSEARGDQPPFSIFGDDLPSVIGSLRFNGGLASRQLEGGLAEDVLATYSDRSACLVATSSDAGSLAVLNVDLGSSNLPSSSLFVPMLGELVQQLMGRSRGGNTVHSGDPLAAYLPAEAGATSGLRIEGPSPTAEAMGTLKEDSAEILWQSTSAGPPGVYKIKRGDETVFALATTLPPEESDLRVLGADVFQDRLAGGRTIHYRAADARSMEDKDSLWNWLAVGCMLCLLGEVFALKTLRT